MGRSWIMAPLAVCVVALVGCSGDPPRDSPPATSTATTASATTPEINTPVTVSPPEERYATIVADGPMFRLDHIWYCDVVVEHFCNQSAAVTEGVLMEIDGCLYVKSVPVDDPNSWLIVYLGGPDTVWDGPGGRVVVGEYEWPLGVEHELPGGIADVDWYLEREDVTSYPAALVECAERGDGKIMNMPTYFSISH